MKTTHFDKFKNHEKNMALLRPPDIQIFLEKVKLAIGKMS